MGEVVEFLVVFILLVLVEVVFVDGVGLVVILYRVTLSMQGPIQPYFNLFPRSKTESKQIAFLTEAAVKIFDPETTANSPISVKLYNH